MPEIRESAGRHEFDGVLQDLSPAGVAALLASLGRGPREPDAHDEAQLSAVEAGARTAFSVVETHRWNPFVHLANLDLACYDREYAPADERRAAKAAHIAGWPDAVDGAVESLDSVPAPVAKALLPAVRGLGESLTSGDADSATLDRGRASLSRLLAHLQDAAATGPRDVSLGPQRLARMLGDPEAMTVDLGRLEEIADAERSRLTERLVDDCYRLRPEVSPCEVVRELLKDHPDDEGIYAEARRLIQELSAFTTEHNLLPELGGSCLVGPAPPSRRYAVAMMSWTGPYEAEAAAWCHVNPPDPSWDEETKDRWRSLFSATTLPAVTAHEVTPGHFAHGRMIRLTARGDIRRSLASLAFVEGWAHYAEQMMLEHGFGNGDPKLHIAQLQGALVRDARYIAGISMHTQKMTMDQATELFEKQAYMPHGPALREAMRGTSDPTYLVYTLGKLEILKLRDDYKRHQGDKFRLEEFHTLFLEQGYPAIRLIRETLLGDAGPVL